jgi:hypothetical protein
MSIKRAAFTQELEKRIENPDVRAVIGVFIENEVPDIFFDAPGSSSGKYHPDFSLGESGLLRHTVVMMNWVDELKRFFDLDEASADIAYAAAALHDTFKGGPTSPWPCTLPDHAPLATNRLLEWWKWHEPEFKDLYTTDAWSDIDDYINDIAFVMSSHMGIWNKPVESRPENMTQTQLCVAMADYCATRKFLNEGGIEAMVADLHFKEQNSGTE